MTIKDMLYDILRKLNFSDLINLILNIRTLYGYDCLLRNIVLNYISNLDINKQDDKQIIDLLYDEVVCRNKVRISKISKKDMYNDLFFSNPKNDIKYEVIKSKVKEFYSQSV